MLTRLCLIVLVLCFFAAAASAQTPTPLFEGELGAPTYDTYARANGVNWIAYGGVYPVGTFESRPACSPPNVLTVGRYTARVEWGGPDFYSVTYRVTFGTGAEARQFVFSGIVEYVPDELTGLPLIGMYSASEIVGGSLTGEYQADFTPHSAVCLGGSLKINSLTQ